MKNFFSKLLLPLFALTAIGGHLAAAQTLRVDVGVINTRGGTSTTADFPVTVNSSAFTTGYATPFAAGTHTVALTPRVGYEYAFSGDCNTLGIVVLTGAQNLICHVTAQDQYGKLTIEKQSVGGSGSFNFNVANNNTSNPNPIGNLLLTTSGSGGTATQTFFTVFPDTYLITEGSQTAGWALSMPTCTNASGQNMGSATSNGISIGIGNGGDVKCKFINTYTAPSQLYGTITVQAQVLSGTTTTPFGISIAPVGTGTVYGPGTGTVMHGQNFNFQVGSGTYTVTPVPQSGWTQTSTTCNNIQVTPGQTKICIFMNTFTGTTTPQNGTVVVQKTVVNGSQATPFTVNIAKVGSGNVVGTSTGTVKHGQSFTFTVGSGTYSVTETSLNNWSMTSSTCSNLQVAPGAVKTCMIVNTFTGTTTPPGQGNGNLIVKTRVVNDRRGLLTPSDFTVHVMDRLQDVANSPRAGSASGTTYTLPAGVYRVHEDLFPLGYIRFYSGDCGRGGYITLRAGETKVCEITNNDW